MMRAALLAAFVVALGASGCSSPRTEVVIVVDSVGLSAPRDLDALHVTVADNAVSDTTATRFDSQPLPLCHDGLTGCYDFPITFTLVPGDKRPDDPVRVEVQALLGTAVVIDDAATFTFLHGKSARLDFTLFPACLGSDCAASDRVCAADGSCTTITPQPFTGEPDLATSPMTSDDLAVETPPDLSMPDLSVPTDLSTMANCDGGVVDITKDPMNCGGCGIVCTNPGAAPNTVAVCNNRVCAIGCATGWGDCDTMPANGCEHDVSSDTMSCGACGHVCGGQNTVGGAVCQNNRCVFNCAGGTAHCSTSEATGCETTIASDAQNCGFCGFDCGSAACSAGFCKYTTGAEQIASASGNSILVQDATTLYWYNSDASHHQIRRVNKDGTGLGNVWDPSLTGQVSFGPTLAVDQNFLYYFNDTYKTQLSKGVKTGVQPPGYLLMDDKIGSIGQTVYLDTDYTANAQYLFFTQTTNGPGLYRVPIAAPVAPPQQISSVDAVGMVRLGTKLYFGAYTAKQVLAFDMYAATPAVSTFATLSGGPQSLATDGVNVYVTCNDATGWAIALADGTTRQLWNNGNTGGAEIVTDGVFVYAANPFTLRVPVGANNVNAANNYKIPGASQSTVGIAVDANALYFTTSTDVYKTKKY